jgi:hypothetical protein
MGRLDSRISVGPFLAAKVEELRVRLGPYSVLVQTLGAALTSGTEVDLRRGKIAFEIWQKTGEQRRLAEIARPLPAPPPLPARRPFPIIPIPSTPPREQQVEQLRPRAKGVKTKVAAPKRRFKGNLYRSMSVGIDFSKPDSLSTSKGRHLLAKRPKQRVKLRPKPRGK